MPQSTTPNSRQVIFRSSIRPVYYPGTTLFEGIVCPKREKTWFEGMGSDLGLDSAGILPSKRVVYLKGTPVRSNEFLKPFVQNEFNCSFFFLRFMWADDLIHGWHVRTGRNEGGTARYGVGSTVKSAAKAQVTSRRRLCTARIIALRACAAAVDAGTVSLEAEPVVLGETWFPRSTHHDPDRGGPWASVRAHNQAPWTPIT
jgi:hypothetical protein